MINFDLDTKYKIDFTNNFKKQLKKDEKLIIILFATGSHSGLFGK